MVQHSVPDVMVKINGVQLPLPAEADLLGVRVEEDLDALSMFTLELGNWDEDLLKASWSDSALFALGAEVELWLGYLDDLHQVMLGEITDLEPQFAAGRAPSLTVRGYDLRHRLDRTMRTQTFRQMTDSAVATRLAQQAGLRADVVDSRTAQEFLIQSNESDLEFLRGRARLIGYELYVRDRVLHFHPPRHASAPARALQIGTDLTDFAARLSARGQVGDISVRGWDVRQKQAVIGRYRSGDTPMGAASAGSRQADRAFGQSAAGLVDVPVAAKARADQVAQAEAVLSGLGYVRAEASGPGLAQLRAGTVVRVDGAGTRFSGPYYVTSAVHDLRAGAGFRTSMHLRRNAS